MKRYLLIIIPVLFLFAPPCQAEEKIDSLLSLDLSYSLTGLLNHGWGIGLNYEKKLYDYLSVKGNFGHMTFLTGIKNVYNTSVSISLFIYLYPLNNGLDELYIGVGNGCDFMNYFGSGELPPETQDTLIHITPEIGWKFNVLPFLTIDVSTGYKFVIYDTQNYKEIKDYINTGFQFGVGFRLFIHKMNKD